MRAPDRERFRLHARLGGYLVREAALLEFLSLHIDERTVVAWSAGKDSSVVAHAAARIRPHIPILMVDPGCPTHWTEAERAGWVDYAAAAKWRLRLFAWDKWSAVGGARDTADHQRRAHTSMFSGMHAWMAENGYDQTITGMRAAESRGRLMHRRTHGKAFTDRHHKRWLMPLADWSTADVWAYLIAHDVPWLGIYDRMGPDARNGIIGRSGDRFGRAQQIHRHYPEYLATARQLLPDLF